jgi:hypothetical protein
MKERKLVAIFGLFFILINYPLITLYQGPQFVAGIPVFFFGLMLIWLAMIVLIAAVVASPRSRNEAP